jgi:hypothetical protein
MMLTTIKELQDLLYQPWSIGQESDADIETQDGRSIGDFYDKDVFTGEVLSQTTGDHICWCEPSVPGKAMADMIIAARNLYEQFHGVDNSDDYIVPGPEADAFLRAFEEFVNQNAGW